eukprot:gene32861-40565_t
MRSFRNKAHNVSVALRTGGHQYSAASSTTGNNIQLDLSEAFKGPIEVLDQTKGLIRVGISLALADFNEALHKLKFFIPHGQCSHVHIGGHAQTGGFGLLGRAFGLFGDHIQTVEIVNSEGKIQKLSRGVGTQDEMDLFYAILGGSPGNFGVLTHLVLKIHKDADHPHSRGLKYMCNYDQGILERLLDIKYANVKGSAATEYELNFAQTWMDKIHKLAGGTSGLNLRCAIVDHANHNKMSDLTGGWIYDGVREFDLPYEKRTNVTNSKTLVQDGWAKWCAAHVDKGMKTDGLKLAIQIQHFGGINSMFKNGDKDKQTSYSWREDSTICNVMDCFYKRGSHQKAIDWVAEIGASVGNANSNFCKEDRRFLWSSYGDYDMTTANHFYHENDEKYKRLCAIRAKADPTGVFQANTFCVGWNEVHRDITFASVASAVTNAASSLVDRLIGGVHEPPSGFDEEAMVDALVKRRRTIIDKVTVVWSTILSSSKWSVIPS